MGKHVDELVDSLNDDQYAEFESMVLHAGSEGTTEGLLDADAAGGSTAGDTLIIDINKNVEIMEKSAEYSLTEDSILLLKMKRKIINEIKKRAKQLETSLKLAALEAERDKARADSLSILRKSVVPLPSGWACDRHGIGRHSVFVSYRGATEGLAGSGTIEKLVDAIEHEPTSDAVEREPSSKAIVFFGKTCIMSNSRELRLMNGLEGASLVVPIMSAAALQSMIEHAATRRDDLLTEWEIALERQRAGLCKVLPIIVPDDVPGGSVDFSGASYPDAPHFGSGISIRSTLAALFKCQIDGLKFGQPIDLTNVELVHMRMKLTEVADAVRGLLNSEELRKMRQRAQQEYEVERGRKDQMWKRVEAILDVNDVIGRGASSVVFRGRLHPHEPDDPQVAVKALNQNAVAASKQFSTELEIMKGLEVRPRALHEPLWNLGILFIRADHLRPWNRFTIPMRIINCICFILVDFSAETASL